MLAFRLAHFVNFWLGRPDAMLASVSASSAHWSDAAARLTARSSPAAASRTRNAATTPGPRPPAAPRSTSIPAICGRRMASRMCMEMQGRRGEGIAWLDGLGGNWDGGNNLRIICGGIARCSISSAARSTRVLALYDSGFRNLASPLTQAQPDLYIDVQNAASMLFRLQRHGVDVGDRWEELADKAEARIGDCLSAFTLPHWMMALAATGRDDAAQRMLERCAHSRKRPGTIATLVGSYALPVCEAVLAHARGDIARAVAADAAGARRHVPARRQPRAAGRAGAALPRCRHEGGLHDDVRLLLERVAGRHPCRRSGASATPPRRVPLNSERSG